MTVGVLLAVTGVMFLWALCFPLIAFGLAAAPPMAFAAIRALLAGVALLLVAQGCRRPPTGSRGHWGIIALIGFSATGLGFFGMFYGGARVAPGVATVIANMQPLIAAVIAWRFWGDSLVRHQWTGLWLGFGGIALIGAPSLTEFGSSAAGMGFILLGALGTALGNVLMSRMAGRFDIVRAMGWQLVIGSIPLGLLSWLIEDPTTINWSWSFLSTLLALSMLGTALPFVAWFALLQHSSLHRLNVFTFLTPVFGLLMGFAFYAEAVSLLTAAGIVLCLLGVIRVNVRTPALTLRPGNG